MVTLQRFETYMKHIFFLLAIVLGTSVFAQVNQTDAQGRKQGKWEKFYEGTRQVRYRGQFVNNVPTGVFTYYHQNGRKRSEITYRGTTGNGYCVMYELEGWKLAEGVYRGEVKDSVWRYYGPSGDLVSTTTWVMGEKTGEEKVFYHDGTLAELTNYSHNMKEGKWLQNFPDGSLKARGEYQNNALHGEVMYNDQTGRPLMIGTYVHGIKNGSWIIFEGGTPQWRETYDMGDLLQADCLRPEGCPTEEEEEGVIEE